MSELRSFTCQEGGGGQSRFPGLLRLRSLYKLIQSRPGTAGGASKRGLQGFFFQVAKPEEPGRPAKKIHTSLLGLCTQTNKTLYTSLYKALGGQQSRFAGFFRLRNPGFQVPQPEKKNLKTRFRFFFQVAKPKQSSPGKAGGASKAGLQGFFFFFRVVQPENLGCTTRKNLKIRFRGFGVTQFHLRAGGGKAKQVYRFFSGCESESLKKLKN